MDIDEAGRLVGTRYIASPNCDERPLKADITLAVIHNISLPPDEFGGDAILRLFTNTLDYAAHPYFASLLELRVSAHFLIRRSGELIQFVPCGMRAWHAGVSRWRDRDRCNDFSVGIELEGSDDMPYENAQYELLGFLAVALHRRYHIADFVGHCDIAPDRKTDPGPAFDWPRFRAALAAQR